MASLQNDFTMHQFRLFLKVADCGSFSKAATSLGLPQPSVSRLIARIEANTGTLLFERSSRGVILNEAGDKFREHAQHIVYHHDLAISEVQHNSGVLHGEARIATPESVANILFFPLIKQFQSLYPQARVRVITSSSASIPSLIENDVVDIGIIANTHKAPALPLESLCQENLYLIGPKDAKLVKSKSVKLADVASVPLILNAMPGGFRSLIDAAFAKLKLVPEVKIEIDSNEPLLELIIAGEGFSILPFSAIAGESRMRQLSAAKIIDPDIQRNFMLATAVNRPFPAVCREAAHQIRVIMQKHAKQARWIWES